MDLPAFLTHCLSALMVAALPVLALLLGFSALLPLRSRWGLPGAPSLAVSLALGLGLLSHGAWVLAAIGSVTGLSLFSSWLAWGFLIAAILILRGQTRSLLGETRKRLLNLTQTVRDRPISHALAAALLFTVVARLVLLAMSPSFLYDVLEYHLPIVRATLATGSFAPIDGNAYSLMPQGAEMLFALGQLFEGPVGDLAPKLVHVYLGLSAAVLINVMARKLQVPTWLRLLAVLTFLSHPISAKLFADAYVGLATSLYCAAALICWLRACRLPNRLDPILAACFIGLAFSCKYPVAGIAGLPFVLLLAPILPADACPGWLGRRGPWFRKVGMVLLLGTCIGFTYGPWLVRALAYTHSPFPPLTQALTAGEGDSSERAIRTFMSESHQPEAPTTRRFFRALHRRAPVPGILLLAPALFFLLSPHSDRRRRGLSAFVLAGYCVWNCVPHAQDRFLAPLLPPLAVLGVLIVHDLKRWLPTSAGWVALPLAMWVGLLTFGQLIAPFSERSHRASALMALGVISREECRERRLGNVTGGFLNAIDFHLASMDEPKVLLLYEARAAALAPETQVISNTVFDASPLWQLLQSPEGQTPEAALAAVRGWGVTHLAVNEVELARLLATYPATAAHDDAEFERLRKHPPADLPSHPALLAFRRYYPPYHHFSEKGNTAQTEERLDHFLALVQKEGTTVWQTNLAGMRIWITDIRGRE